MSLTRFGISIESALLAQYDKLIKKLGYKNRSEAIRDLIRDRLVQEKWNAGDEEVVGVITISYSHHTREIAEVLTEMQHTSFRSIISTTHVHLDAHNCMEVILVRGKGRDVKKIADNLISIRGVKHGKLSVTTTQHGMD